MSMRNVFAGLVAAMTALFAFAGVATADISQSRAVVDAAKAQGVVGEQADGFIGFVSGGGDAALKAAVAEINAGRAQVYREAAARTGTSVEAAGASAFSTTIFPRVAAGQFYRTADGAWKRK